MEPGALGSLEIWGGGQLRPAKACGHLGLSWFTCKIREMIKPHFRVEGHRWNAQGASAGKGRARSLLKFMFIESVILSNHLILCLPLLLLPAVFSSIRVFSNELPL